LDKREKEVIKNFNKLEANRNLRDKWEDKINSQHLKKMVYNDYNLPIHEKPLLSFLYDDNHKKLKQSSSMIQIDPTPSSNLNFRPKLRCFYEVPTDVIHGVKDSVRTQLSTKPHGKKVLPPSNILKDSKSINDLINGKH